MKQKELSIWIRIIVILAAVCVAILGCFVAPEIGSILVELNPDYASFYWPCLIFIWITAIPVCAFLLMVWQIATDIGRDKSFCHANARRLKVCCILALTDTLLYICGGIVLGLTNALHFSVLFIIVTLVSVGFVITVCCAALSHLTRKAADLQSENDLTV